MLEVANHLIKGEDVKQELNLQEFMIDRYADFSRSGLVEEHSVEVFHQYGVHLSSSLLMQIFS